MTDFFDRVERQLVGVLEREQAAVPGQRSPQHTRRRLRWGWAIPAAAVAAGATFLALPSGSGLISPAAAVAAASASLEGDGVLHWRARSVPGDGTTPDVFDTWVDIKTGAAKRVRIAAGEKNGVPFTERTTTWSNANETWSELPADQRGGAIVVRHQVHRAEGTSAPAPTPLDMLRDALAKAAAGDAHTAETETPDGVAATVVSLKEPGRETELTITREDTPRLISSRISSWSCDPGESCVTPSNDVTSETFVTEQWSLDARTAASLAQVAPPAFIAPDYTVLESSLNP
jgi:hypothetical protein